MELPRIQPPGQGEIDRQGQAYQGTIGCIGGKTAERKRVAEETRCVAQTAYVSIFFNDVSVIKVEGVRKGIRVAGHDQENSAEVEGCPSRSGPLETHALPSSGLIQFLNHHGSIGDWCRTAGFAASYSRENGG